MDSHELSLLSETDLDLHAARTLGLTIVQKEGFFFLKSKPKRYSSDTRFVPHYCADIRAALDLVAHVVESTNTAAAPFRMEIIVNNGETSVHVISDKYGVTQSVSVKGELHKSLSRAITQAAVLWANQSTDQQ